MKSVIYNILSWLVYLFVVGVFTVGGFFLGMMYERDRKTNGRADVFPLAATASTVYSYDDYMHGLAKMESKRPIDFLKINDFSPHSGLFSSSVTIDCQVTNWAFMTPYKDVEFEITCLSKTGTPIETVRRTAYEFIPARSSRELSVKFKPPDETKTYGVRIIDAGLAHR